LLLMREVDHRAKNALAVVHSLVQLTPESDPKTFKAAIQGRIAALARTHALLADERWEGADLLALTRDELAPFAALPDCDVAIDGLSFRLRPADAQAMALVIHELATNAAKHGALARAGGRLAIAWRYAEGAGLAFTWRETNAGGGAANPSASGFGFTLLDQLIARQMGGAWTREWTGEGFACAITLPGRPAAQAADAG
jgi:two-component sensor histidine kinase